MVILSGGQSLTGGDKAFEVFDHDPSTHHDGTFDNKAIFAVLHIRTSSRLVQTRRHAQPATLTEMIVLYVARAGYHSIVQC